MTLIDKYGNPLSAGKNTYSIELAARMKDAVTKKRDLLVELKQQSENLTKKDIATWRRAWQAALNYENPSRGQLLDVYNDALADLHLTGCISQRKGKTLRKKFILLNKDGKENDDARKVFEREWFIDFLELALDRPFFGHSLIQFGDIITVDGIKTFRDVGLVPRKHVVPEYGVIVREPGDEWKKGTSYREGKFAEWCLEVGSPNDLGLLLKCSPQALSKKNMLGYWDAFGELFGMPIRIGKTMSQDAKDIARIENMLDGMGAAAWGLFPEGTEIEIKETTRGDAFNVYDRRVERCNSEMSKGTLNQTMTIDNGSSLSQSATHLEMFENVCKYDDTRVQFLVNDKLIPFMGMHGLLPQGVTFEWDEAMQYTPAEQREIERLVVQEFDVDPKYFEDKYKITIKGKKQASVNHFFD